MPEKFQKIVPKTHENLTELIEFYKRMLNEKISKRASPKIKMWLDVFSNSNMETCEYCSEIFASITWKIKHVKDKHTE